MFSLHNEATYDTAHLSRMSIIHIYIYMYIYIYDETLYTAILSNTLFINFLKDQLRLELQLNNQEKCKVFPREE